MRICLFCENRYAIGILEPVQDYVNKTSGDETLWYVDSRKIKDFPFKDKVTYTNSMQEVYDWSPEMIICPGNIVPFYLPGVKTCVFHGYADKKDQFIIRRYFDIYYTQGPYFTNRFKQLWKRYKDFEVIETGWPRQDWIVEHLHSYDEERQAILEKYGKQKIVLYAPTFSPSLTSLPYLKDSLKKLAQEEDIVLMCKFHPLTAQKWLDEYKQLSEEVDNIICVDDFSISKFMFMCDMVISDSSSTIYECLLLDKPVITYKSIESKNYWCDIKDANELSAAYHDNIERDAYAEKRRWVIENYDPYLDGRVVERMLDSARDFIRRHGVPRYRKLNLWRQYTSVKTFGFIKRNKK